MLALLPLAFAFVTASYATAPSSQYASLMQSLTTAHRLRAVLNYSSCLLDGGPSVKATGGYEVESWMVSTADRTVIIDNSKLIYNYQSKTGGYVYDFVRTTVYPNGTVTSMATDVPAPDPNIGPAMYSEIFTCSLVDGSARFVPGVEVASISPTYSALMAALDAFATVRVVVEVPKCAGGESLGIAATGFKIDTFEAFDDPAKFGPPEMAWGTDTLTYGELGTWVRRQTKASFSAVNSTLTVAYTDLDPRTLAPVKGAPIKIVCPLVGDAVRLYAVVPDRGQLLRFRGYILGHFSNAAQHANKGDNHPLAEHVSDVANQKVINAPPDFFDDDRFFVLEESYYTTVENGTQSTTSRAMIFLFHPEVNGSVSISAYSPPKGTPTSALRNNNTALRLDFSLMELTQDFNTATYEYDPVTKSFHLDAVTPSPTGIFRLTETIAANKLTVMEDVIIGGHSVMPYHTPIIYDRI